MSSIKNQFQCSTENDNDNSDTRTSVKIRGLLIRFVGNQNLDLSVKKGLFKLIDNHVHDCGI